MNKTLKALASPRLTVWLLVLGMLLVLVGTFAQADTGLYQVKKQYFETFVVFAQLPGTGFSLPVFPGGFTLTFLLLVNLVVAHTVRFKVLRGGAIAWNQAGLFLTHIGLIVLVLGSLTTAVLQEESSLALDEGQAKNYTESSSATELVVIYGYDDELDEVVSIPNSIFRRQGAIDCPGLPFTLHVRSYMPNAVLSYRPKDSSMPAPATQGSGTEVLARPPRTKKEAEGGSVTVIVEVKAADESLGTWLLSAALTDEQALTWQGREFRLAVRHERTYTPYTIKLVDFTHERYPGTNIPRNFSSLVTVTDPATKTNREVLIYMNHPLRHDGKTYYQSSFANEDTTSILQVVWNPTWLLPYIATIVISLGLTVQFLVHLKKFLSRRATA